MVVLGPVLRLIGASVGEIFALRRRAVRDVLAGVFVSGLRRSLLAVILTAVLLGVILFRYVLPLIPIVGSNPAQLAATFLFTVQHLGDVVAGLLVVGQAGLLCTWELVDARDRRHFAAATASGIDALELFVLPRVWGVALLFVFVQMVFKVVTVTAGAYAVRVLDGHFYGPEIGDVIARYGTSILGGYGVNLVLGLLVASICAAPALDPVQLGSRTEPPIARVFLLCLTLLFVVKLLQLALVL